MCRHYVTNRQGDTLSFGFDFMLGEFYYQRVTKAGNVVAMVQPVTPDDIYDQARRLRVLRLIEAEMPAKCLLNLALDLPCCPENHNNITEIVHPAYQATQEQE